MTQTEALPPQRGAKQAQKRATPTIKRRRVGAQLRHYRDLAGLSSVAAARKVGMDNTRLARVERGTYRISAAEVRDLATAYGVSDDVAISGIAEAAEEPASVGWWHPYKDVAGQALLDYIALESEAMRVQIWAPSMVLGLLQTPAYAREVIHTSVTPTIQDRLERLVALRIARQQVLTRPGAPLECEFLVPESAFHTRFRGGPSVIKDQLRRLLDVSEAEHVTLRVVELAAPPHSGHVTFTNLFFRHPWRPLVSFDNQSGGNLAEDDRTVTNSVATFEQIASLALSVDDSRKLITRYLEGTQK
ncbi:helix-turn-helix domain-containing protein [Streptomyces sp. BI20]|uniref:helix-turn-helix domain-containing protein n=1 Tax=Streptomyces sp. BI20 TaxID=3403460 RepID=UPI003C751817